VSVLLKWFSVVRGIDMGGGGRVTGFKLWHGVYEHLGGEDRPLVFKRTAEGPMRSILVDVMPGDFCSRQYVDQPNLINVYNGACRYRCDCCSTPRGSSAGHCQAKSPQRWTVSIRQADVAALWCGKPLSSPE